MKQGSTFVLVVHLQLDMSYVKSIIFTLKNKGKILTKENWSFEDGKFKIPFTQEETVQLDGRTLIEAQINFKDGNVAKSEIKEIFIKESLATRIVEGNKATEETQEIGLAIAGDVVYTDGVGGGDYKLPIATESTIGGVKPLNKTDDMTLEVGVDKEGRLFAKGRAPGYVFDTLADLELALEDVEFTSKLVLGDNLYIRATDVPDYWWDGEQKQQLETQKVDLTGYATKNDLANHYVTSGKAIGSSLGIKATAEGYNTQAGGSTSHAEGNSTYALGESSHAEGYLTQALGSYSHSEGRQTKASGKCSHAEGGVTEAIASYSHAEGYSTLANAICTHTEGQGTIASSKCQHAEGNFNIEDANQKYLHIIGNGTSDKNRSNAHTVDWQGNAEYAGDVKANAYGGTSISLVEVSGRVDALEQGGSGGGGGIALPNSAASHNAIFRGEDLTNKYTIDQICERISSGTFEDLYIGDYFDITFTNPDSSSEETMRCIFAAFDYYYNQQAYGCTKHHAVIIPKNCIGGSYGMNMSYTNHPAEGAYTGSQMFKITLPALVTPLQTVLNNHIITHKNDLASAINAEGNSAAGAGMIGYASSSQYRDVTITIPNEIQVYGTQIWSSSPYNVGLDTTILPLFAHNPMARVCGRQGVADGGTDWSSWWLRDVVDYETFAIVESIGGASYRTADDNLYGLRPLFLIG